VSTTNPDRHAFTRRREARVRVTRGVTVLIDGNPAVLVDVSAGGAQIVSDLVLRPNQRIRIALPGAGALPRFSGVVAWALFEMTSGSPRYRAGVQFLDADAGTVRAFAERNQEP
jgi:PilZ domain